VSNVELSEWCCSLCLRISEGMYVAIFVARDSKGDDWHISHLSSPVSYVYEGHNVPRCIGPPGNAAAARRTSSDSAMAFGLSINSSIVRL
jgi:hypothetical protein